jgi:translation elongation factor EF-Ts
VNAFHLFVVGEGIKRKSTDFVAEVMAQLGRA